jgi:DNA repair exonuclease SbcCD ATPase subunit
VTKVIKMLQTMQEELTTEKENDQELYDKLSCWCETNEKNKEAAIATATSTIDGCTSDIQALESKTTELKGTIATLNDEVAKNDAALRKADALRQKDLAEFNANEKDLIQSISSLKGAVTTMSKHHSFLQTGTQVHSLKHELTAVLKRASLSVEQKQKVQQFLEQPAGFSSYEPASGQIFGILEQMKETFETNLADAQKEEAEAASDFASLKKAKTTEIAEGRKMSDEKVQELGKTAEELAATKQNLADTEDALEADTVFLKDLKVRCANADAEFEERTKARNLELSAVADTIALLNSDEAHAMFGKTMGFVQVSRSTSSRIAAAEKVRSLAKRTGSTLLAGVAVAVKEGALDEVKESIDKMVAELKVEQQDEVKHRDFCVEEFNENKHQTVVNEDELKDLTTDIETLTSTLDTLTKELAAAKAEIADTKLQMKRAGEDREAENAEFQQTVADQRAAQQILTMALTRMKEVYGFVQVKAATQLKSKQEPGAAAPPMPAGFDDYSENKGGGGALNMIQTIIDDSKKMEMDALAAEQDSQSSYTEFVKNGNASIKALLKAVTDKTEKKARAEQELVRAKEGHSTTLKNLESLHEYKGTLHKSCDFVMENFTERQGRRTDEIKGLQEAMAIISNISI